MTVCWSVRVKSLILQTHAPDVVGATQFWHQEERWTDGIMGMNGVDSGLAFNYKTGLNDGWRLDVCSEITILAQVTA